MRGVQLFGVGGVVYEDLYARRVCGDIYARTRLRGHQEGCETRPQLGTRELNLLRPLP